MRITQNHRDFAYAIQLLLLAGEEHSEDAAKLLAKYTDLLGSEEACSLFNFMVAEYYGLVSTPTKQ